MSKTSGKHNPDDVMIGLLDSPEVKAVFGLVAEAEMRANVADMIRRLVFDAAIRHGIMRTGDVVTDKYRDEVLARAAAIRADKKRSSRRRKKAKATNTTNTSNTER